MEVNYFLKLSVIHCKNCSSLIDNDIIHHDELILLYDKLVTTVLFRKKERANNSSVFGFDLALICPWKLDLNLD